MHLYIVLNIGGRGKSLSSRNRVAVDKAMNACSASQEISPHFMEPEVSLLHLQQPAACHTPKQDESDRGCASYFRSLKFLAYCLPIHTWVFPAYSFLYVPSAKPCTYFYSALIRAVFTVHLILHNPMTPNDI
jgi:hypothetical protein